MSIDRASADALAAMTVREAAAFWFVREDSGGLRDSEKHAFLAWIESSEEHRRAYEETRAMWVGFIDAADAGELRALRVAALAVAPKARIWLRAVSAVSTVAVVGLAFSAWTLATRQHPVETESSPPSAMRYVTAHNERSTVTLPDGSIVSMNRDTELDVDYLTGRRVVQLVRGQAFFEVAKDVDRPFVVKAADRNIYALGTRFDVRMNYERVEVVLVEGRVSVEPNRLSPIQKILSQRAPIELSPGERLVADVGHAPKVSVTNAVKATSWREGWVVFEDDTVEHAVTELNRYSNAPIVIADDAVKKLRISGVFRIGLPDRFGSIIQELLPIEVERGVNGETILAMRPGAELSN